jgi:hypothetical protein
MVSDAAGKQISFKAYGAGDPRFAGVWEEDQDGNLWAGRTRLSRNGFVNYGQADGLADENIRSIFESSDGALYVVTGAQDRFIVSSGWKTWRTRCLGLSIRPRMGWAETESSGFTKIRSAERSSAPE